MERKLRGVEAVESDVQDVPEIGQDGDF